VAFKAMKLLFTVFIHSLCRFHHSCRDWRHNHWCLSGSWLQFILVHMHKC